MRNTTLFHSTFFLLGFALASATAAGQDAMKTFERTYALRTTSGYYLTAENGGGMNVNTDRKELGPWETFTMISVAPGVFGFKTADGHFLGELSNERRLRQGRGGLMASKTAMDSTTQFRIMLINPEGPVVTLMTAAGKYVTAENGGGTKARGMRAMSTDRAEIGDWEQFTLVDVEREKAKPSGN